LKQQLVAECSVWRKDTDKPFTVQVAYNEYVQRTNEGAPTKFWAEKPDALAIFNSGLQDHPLLMKSGIESVIIHEIDSRLMTAKEYLLWEYLLGHPNQVCEKDDLIRAIWPEDKIFTEGIRDDSLAQLVRRLRVKVEPNPAMPTFIHTIPGRGYRYTPQ